MFEHTAVREPRYQCILFSQRWADHSREETVLFNRGIHCPELFVSEGKRNVL